MRSWFHRYLALPTILTAISVSGFAQERFKPSAERGLKRFRETEELFANPGQGWMTMQRLPHGEGRFPCSVAYFRLNWDAVEPEEGKFNWQLIDESLQAWAKRGARVAFRVMTTNAHSKGYYCSPKWLFDAGCLAGSLDVPATVRAGQYTLGVALVDPTTEKPAIHLAIDAPHVERLYRLSEVSVEIDKSFVQPPSHVR